MPTPRRRSSRSGPAGTGPSVRARARRRRTPDNHVTIFVFGLLGLMFCPVFAFVAWIMGNVYLQQCHAVGMRPDSLGSAGRILGIIGVILTIAVGLLYLILIGGLFAVSHQL